MGVVWALVAIGCILLAIKFRGFRLTLLAIVGLLIVVIAAYAIHRESETESSKHLVRADQLEFTDMRLGPSDYGSYTLTGRVRNNSAYTVFEVKARVHVLDCNDQSHCDVVGDEDVWDMAPLVPPGEVRDINTTVYFGNGTQVRGQFEWNYKITEIRARR